MDAFALNEKQASALAEPAAGNLFKKGPMYDIRKQGEYIHAWEVRGLTSSELLYYNPSLRDPKYDPSHLLSC